MNNIKSKDVKIISIQDLRENPKNRNNHPEAQLKVLEKIIKDNGFREPIIVSGRSGYIIAGHARLTVAKRLGFTEVPVSIQDFDSDEAEMKHLIASNEIARYAEFDKDNFLKDFGDDLNDIDFELYGLIDFKLEGEALKAKDYGDHNSEIETEGYGNDLQHQCPKCGFEFNE